jgi:hypothetical protein
MVARFEQTPNALTEVVDDLPADWQVARWFKINVGICLY